MSVEERLTILERRNRRLSAALGSMVLGFVAFLTVGASGDGIPDVVRARKFQVVNDQGEPAVEMGHYKYGWLGLMGPAGQDRIALVAYADGGVIQTYNARGQDLLKLGALTTGEGRIVTYNGRGSVLVELGGSEGGRGTVTTFDSNGKELVELGAVKSGEGRVSTYRDRRQLVTLGATVLGDGAVAAFDHGGRLTAQWP